jgi:hypothetical protein
VRSKFTGTKLSAIIEDVSDANENCATAKTLTILELTNIACSEDEECEEASVPGPVVAAHVISVAAVPSAAQNDLALVNDDISVKQAFIRVGEMLDEKYRQLTIATTSKQECPKSLFRRLFLSSLMSRKMKASRFLKYVKLKQLYQSKFLSSKTSQRVH